MYKKLMSLLLICMLCITSLPAFAGSDVGNVQHSLYVALDGSDDNDGSVNAPFRTIERAQAEVRKLNDNMTGDIVVYIRGGVHRLSEPLVFTPEDSGSNGYYIRYTAYPGENVKISGGKKIENWQKTDGKAWVTTVEGIEYAMQLSVNDRRAIRARSNERIVLNELYKAEGSKYNADGMIIYEGKYADYINQEDIQVHFARGWKSYLLNVDRIEKTDKGCLFYMEQPFFHGVIGKTETYDLLPGNNFHLENAYEELDTEGEFYYNRATKELFYIPREDEDMTTADVELAVTEKLIQIKGKDSAQKVKNIAFDSLTFAHATWLRASRYGVVTDQAQTMIPHNNDIPLNPGYTMVDANITINRAEKISFTNNVFRDLGCVAIALVEGVYNCRFEGNVFCDIGDSAMTIGTIEFAYQDAVYNGRDLAHAKLTTSSSGHGRSTYYSSYSAVDGNKRTGWSPQGTGPFWWQVDLGEPYRIHRIEIDDRIDTDNAIARRSFEIVGSNDPTFETYTVLASQGPEAYPHKGTAKYYVEAEDEFRYVRVRKSDTSYLFLTEVRIINEDMEYAPASDLCKNNLIKNNYITRIGVMNYSAPGIQAYYSTGTNIVHNTLEDLPYSAICSGWGWNTYPDLKDARDNKINYNRIDKPMQICIDGGGIYTLGRQQNSQMIGNYISDQMNPYGGIYGDNSTSFFTYKDNVVEETCISYLGSGRGEGISWENNYTTTAKDMISTSKGLRKYNNKIYMPGDPPLGALETMMNAGLEKEYKHIEEKAGNNYWPYTLEDVTNNSQYEMEYVLMNDNNYVVYFLNYQVLSARSWLDMAEIGTEPGMYPREAADKFSEAIEEAAAIARKEPVDKKEIIKARQALVVDALSEFNASRIVYSPEKLLYEVNKELTTTPIGTGLGQITQKNYDKLVRALKLYEEEPDNELKKMFLDKSLIEFIDNKITLDILSFSMEGQIGKEKIDHENGTITVDVKNVTDISSISPIVGYNDQVRISPDPAIPQDFTKDVTYTLTTPDKSMSKTYTVKAIKPVAFNPEGEYSLKDAIADKGNWSLFGTYNINSYQGKLFGDATFTFDMEIEQRTAYDWPSFVFRSQDPEKSFDDAGNNAYIIVFNPGSIELHRFNKGVRTQFYGPVKNVKTIYGGSLVTDVFKFNQKNKMKLTTRNEADGVRIILEINGEKLIDILDNYDGAITNAGYIATVSPSAPVVLTAD